MKIALGTDHAGYPYKEKIKTLLREQGHDVLDFGTFSEDPVDYPLFVRPAALSVVRGESKRGIILGGSGNGEAMVANRIPGIRCALCWNPETARLAREHNDANMISLGARMISLDEALGIVKIWLETPFAGGRHLRRIQQIDRIEGILDPSSRYPLLSGKDAGKGHGGTLNPEHDVLIAFRYIKYMEGDHSLEFRIDPNLKAPSMIHIPSAERWRSDLPDWARDRRDEILERIKTRCSHMECTWEEF